MERRCAGKPRLVNASTRRMCWRTGGGAQDGTEKGKQRAGAYFEHCLGARRPIEGAEKGHETALMALWEGAGLFRYAGETHCASISSPLDVLGFKENALLGGNWWMFGCWKSSKLSILRWPKPRFLAHFGKSSTSTGTKHQHQHRQIH
jgi:hypothetical protein